MASPSPVVVITGAASGIGRALAELYLKQGARVAALDRDIESLEKWKASCDGERAFICAVDVSRELEMQAAATAIQKTWGQPDIWINNAGVAALGKFEEISSTEFEKVVAINFYGVVYGTRVALSLMRQPERGTIVNVASVNGSVAAPFMSSYVAAKHAVLGFTHSVQLELEQTQSAVKLILVCPGWVKTPIMSAHPGFKFPSWLEWTVESPEAVAQEIAAGIRLGKREMTPTMNGKLLRGAHHLAPSWVERSSRLLTAQNWKEALGLSKIKK